MMIGDAEIARVREDRAEIWYFGYRWAERHGTRLDGWRASREVAAAAGGDGDVVVLTGTANVAQI